MRRTTPCSGSHQLGDSGNVIGVAPSQHARRMMAAAGSSYQSSPERSRAASPRAASLTAPTQATTPPSDTGGCAWAKRCSCEARSRKSPSPHTKPKFCRLGRRPDRNRKRRRRRAPRPRSTWADRGARLSVARRAARRAPLLAQAEGRPARPRGKPPPPPSTAASTKSGQTARFRSNGLIEMRRAIGALGRGGAIGNTEPLTAASPADPSVSRAAGPTGTTDAAAGAGYDAATTDGGAARAGAAVTGATGLGRELTALVVG